MLRGGFPGFGSLGRKHGIYCLEAMCKYHVLNVFWEAPVDTVVRIPFPHLSLIESKTDFLMTILLVLQAWVQNGQFSLLHTWVGPSHPWDARQISALMSFKSILFTLKSPLPQLQEFVRDYYLGHRKEILLICQEYIGDVDNCTYQFRYAMRKILAELREALPKALVEDLPEAPPEARPE